MTDAQQDHALAVESVVPELADLRIDLCPSHMSEGCFWMIYFVLLHPKLRKEDAEILSTPQILESRERLSHDLQYQTKLERGKEGTVHAPFSNEDAALSSPVVLLGVSKDQDDFVMATSFRNIYYGNQEVLSTNTVSDSGAVSSDNISSNVTVQLVPVLKDAIEVSQSSMEESTSGLSTKNAVAEEQPVLMSEIALMDKSPPKDYQQRQPSADVNEQSRVIIQKTDNNDDDDEDDGDEWLEEEETGGSRRTTIPIADDEDISFSDLEEEDGAA